MTNNIDDFSNARCILAIGTNAPEAHPVLVQAPARVYAALGPRWGGPLAPATADR